MLCSDIEIKSVSAAVLQKPLKPVTHSGLSCHADDNDGLTNHRNKPSSGLQRTHNGPDLRCGSAVVAVLSLSVRCSV